MPCRDVFDFSNFRPGVQASARILAASIVFSACTGCGDREAGPDAWPTGWVLPVEGASLSLRRADSPGEDVGPDGGAHRGFDLVDGYSGKAFGSRERVVAAADGVVRVLREPGLVASGEPWQSVLPAPLRSEAGTPPGAEVWIEHDQGYWTRYAGMTGIEAGLETDTGIAQGDPLGYLDEPEPPQDDLTPAGEGRAFVHFELWSVGDKRFLGQGVNLLEAHRAASRIFGPDALPRYAHRILLDSRQHRNAATSYPPEDPPPMRLTATRPDQLEPGRCRAVPVRWDGDLFHPADLQARISGREVGVLAAEGGAFLLVAVPAGFRGAVIDVAVNATDIYGRTSLTSMPVKVNRAAGRSAVPDTDTGPQPSIPSELRTAVDSSLRMHRPQWNQSFQWPVPGPVVIGFGGRRHDASLDSPAWLESLTLRASAGRPVAASNAGVVASAGTVGASGTVVGLAHGGGLLTVYWPLSELAVEVGQSVERGETLGRLAVGGDADLHWSMVCADLPVNPAGWIGKALVR